MGTFSKNPNPVLRAGKNGTIICANSAASPLLEMWEVRKGDKLPLNIGDVVRKALLEKSPEELELNAGEKTYSFCFQPFPEEACVNLYGFDITERVLEVDKLRKRCEDLENLLEKRSSAGANREQAHEALPGHEVNKLQNTILFLETLLDTIPAPVLYKDKNLRYLGCNEPFAKQVIGLPTAEILGKTLPELQRIREILAEKAEIYHRQEQALLNKGSKDSFETEFLCADGTRRDFLVSRAAFRAEKEEASSMVAVMLDVTELRQVEKDLKNNLMFLETLLDNIPSPIFHRDRYGNYINCNEKFASQIMGLSKEEVTGSSILDFQKTIPEELASIYMDHDRELILEGGSQYPETEVMCTDGIKRNFLFSKAAYSGDSGEVAGVVGVMLDISERKLAEELLRRSKESCRIILEQTERLVFDSDLVAKKIEWAGAIEKITGYGLEEFQKLDGDSWVEQIHPEDKEELAKAINRSLETGEKLNEEFRFKRKDGTYIYVEYSSVYLKDEKGSVSRALGVIKDITERKLSQEIIKRSEEKYRLVVEQTGQVLYDYDIVTGKIEWAGAIEAVTGYGFEELQAVDFTGWAEHIHPEDRNRALGTHYEALETGSQYHEEYRFRRKDGSYFYAEDRGIYLKDEKGRVFRLQGVIKDITERKLAQEKLKESEERFRIAVGHTGQIVYDRDSSTGYIYWEGAVKEITGYRVEELQEFDVPTRLEHVHPEDRRRVRVALKRSMKTGDNLHEEYRFRRKDGSYYYIEDSATFLKDEKDCVYKILGVIKDITERKLVQKQLEESEERFRITAEQTGQVVYDCNVETRKVELVGAIKALTGYGPEALQDLNASTWIEHVHPEDRDKAREIHVEARKTGSHYHGEYRIQRKDGSYFYGEDSGVFLKGENGEISRLLGVITNITGRKLTQAKLEESEERFRVAAEQTGQIVFEHDLENAVVKWSGAITELTGYSVEEFENSIGHEWITQIHPEDRERAREEFKKLWKDADRFRVEYRFRRKDGSYFYVEDSGIYTRDEKGKILKALGVIKDISAIKLAAEKLRVSERRYRSFIENFKGIAYQGEMDFTPIFIHGALEEITGYREEEFLSGNMRWVQLIEPEDMPVILKNAEKLRLIQDTFIEHDYRIRKKDGELRWVHEAIQNVSAGHGEKRMLQGAIYDITEKKEIEENLAKIQEIRKKEIHHRIKNNLQVISSLLELESDKFKDPVVVEAFRESQNRVISMSIIHEELYKSRDMENIDFAAYLRKLTADLLRCYKVGEKEVLLKLSLEDVFLKMDTAIPLGIVVNELVSNSLKHAFSEGQGGEIHIKLHQVENYENKIINNMRSNISENRNSDRKNQYILVISDNGLGFPENVDFRNTDSLGLQLVNALVEQIDGNIEVYGGGKTEFRIGFLDEV